MGAAPMLLPDKTFGVAFAGGSGIGADLLRGAVENRPVSLPKSRFLACVKNDLTRGF
jgi:hypothetical protein